VNSKPISSRVGAVRPSQLMFSYGVGSVGDLPNFSDVIAGLEAWAGLPQDRILENAQAEGDRIIARAQEQAAFLIEERELTRAAQELSARIVAEAEEQAAEIRRGADEYAASVLVGLEDEVVKLLQGIRRGITMLDDRQPLEPDTTDVDEDQEAAV